MEERESKRSTEDLTTLDEFLKEEGKLEEFEAVAISEVLIWQIANKTRT
jgi:antitoxin HicB